MVRFEKEQVIEEIVSRVDIVEVISEHVGLNKKGKDFWGCCPFHQEDTASFAVSPDKQVYYCFGCQAGGNVITFLRKKENLTYFEAISLLAERTGIQLGTGMDTSARQQYRSEKQRFQRLNDLAVSFFHDALLNSPEGEVAREYLFNRGVNQESIVKFRLGYASQYWDALLKYLTQQGYSPGELEKCGLVVARTSGGGYYDRFRNRLIFPIADQTGQAVGFGGRILEEGTPKYLNSPESRFFDKGKILYGLHLARQSTQEQQQTIVVEGYMDALMCHQAGINNVVASMGTALTSSQVQMILRYVPELVLAYDTDSAGQAATLRAIDMIRNSGGRVRVVSLFEDKDPDELIRKHGAEYFRGLVTGAQDFLAFKLQRLLIKGNPRTAEEKIRVLAEFWEDLRLAGSELERQEYCERLSMALQVPESVIRDEFRKNMGKFRKNQGQLDKNTNNVHTKNGKLINNRTGREIAERNLLRLMLEDYRIFKRVEKEYGLDLFMDDELRQIIQVCREATFTANEAGRIEGSVSLAKLVEDFADDSIRESLLRMCLEDSSFPVFTESQKEKAFQDYIHTLYQYQYRKRLEELHTELNQTVQKGEQEQSMALVAEMKRIKSLEIKGNFH
jgi:DNA primase